MVHAMWCKLFFCIVFYVSQSHSYEEFDYNADSDEIHRLVNYETTTENFTLGELVTNLREFEKNMGSKLENLEQEIQQIKTSNDEKWESKLETLKEELDQQLEKQKQDLAILLPPSSHISEHENNPCGGSIFLNGVFDLNYENAGNRTDQEACVWAILAPSGSSINVTLLSLDLSDLPFETLGFYQLFHNQSNPSFLPMTTGELGQEFSIEDKAAILVFRSWGGQNFHFKIEEIGERFYSGRITANFLGRTVHDAASFSHPLVLGTKYAPNERRLIVIKSFGGKKIRLSIDYLNTLKTDFLFVYKFSQSKNRLLYLQRYAGSLGEINYLKFEGDDNEPMVLYFHSMLDSEGAGFKISYSYRNSNETLPSFWRAIPIQNKFEQCGGLIPILSHTELIYTNPGKLNDAPETCVWLLWFKNGGPGSILLEGANFETEFVPILTLTAQSEFSNDGNATRQLSLTEDLGKEFELAFEPVGLLVFTSRSGQSMHLTLRDMGPFSPTPTTWVNFKLIEMDSNLAQNCKYPEKENQYQPNEQRFIILQQFPSQSINLQINSVNTPPGDDYLKIYQFAQQSKHKFEHYASFSGDLQEINQTFVADPGQSFLIYFEGNSYPYHQGFNFTYQYTPPKQLPVGKLTFDPELTHSAPCGGSIALSQETELTFFSSSEVNVTEVTCFWLISTTNYGMIGYTLLEEELTNSTLTIQPLRLTENSTDMTFIRPSPDGLRREFSYMNTGAFLIFSTHENQGQGFKLLLRQLGQTVSTYITHPHLTSKLTTLTLDPDSTGSFLYPETDFQLKDNTYLILKPSLGQNLNLYMDKLTFDRSYSSLKIFQFSNQRHALELAPLDGSVGVAFTSHENWPVLIYFQTHDYIQSSRLSIPYSSQPAQGSIEAENSTEVKGGPTRSVPCYELLTVRSPMELIYRNPGKPEEEDTCVWILSAAYGGPFNLTLRSLGFANLSSSLMVHRFLPDSATNMTFGVDKIDDPTTLTGTNVLTFRSWGGQSFHMRIEDRGKQTEAEVEANFLGQSSNESTVSTFSRNYYHPLEKHYVVIKPMRAKNISLSIDYLNTETPHDTLSVFKFSKGRDRFLFLQKLTGPLGSVVTARHLGDENEPMILYFSADSSIQNQGYRLSYSYRMPNESTSKIWRTLHTGETSELCGGLVSIPSYSKINYTNNGNDTTIETTCVWVLWSSNGGSAGLELESFNFTGSDNISAHLSLQTQPRVAFIKKPREITAADKSIEIDTEDDPLAILVFVSRPGQSFELGVREIGVRRALYSNLAVNFDLLNRTIFNNTPVSFTYPRLVGSSYTANEQRFLLVNGMAGKSINLSIDYVETASSSDLLKIYKFLKDEKRFQYYGRFSGPLEEMKDAKFMGEEGQPFLLYFTSNSYLHGRGFRISYSYENSTTDNYGLTLDPPFSGTCGGIISLVNATEIKYYNSGDPAEKICVWVITGVNEGVTGHTLLEQNLITSNETLTIQTGLTFTSTISTYSIQSQDVGREKILNENTIFLIFKSDLNVTGQGFRLGLREFGKTRNLLEMTGSNGGHQINLKSHESGSMALSFPTVRGSVGSKERFYLILTPSTGELVNFALNFVNKDPSLDSYKIFKYSTTNNSLTSLQRSSLYWNSREGTLPQNSNLYGNENEPLVLIFYYAGRRVGSEFIFSYASQPMGSLSSPNNVTEGRLYKDLNSACGGLLQTPEVLQINYTRPETCVWVVRSSNNGPMTWSWTSANMTNSSLTIQQHVGSEGSVLTRLIRPENLGAKIPVKKQFAMLVLTSKGNDSFILNMEDLGSTGSTSGQTETVKVIANYIGGWANQNYGTFSYPPRQIPDSLYSNQERRHLILKSLPAKITRLSIDFVSTEMDNEMDDYLDVFKFSKQDNKFVFLKRFTGELGHNIKDAMFDGDVGEPFFLYFHTDQYFKGKGFKISYWYHDPTVDMSKNNRTILNQPSFAADFCRSISSCSECVRKKCLFTGQSFGPCRSWNDLKDFSGQPLKTIQECKEKKPLAFTGANKNLGTSRTSLEIAGIAFFILMGVVLLVIVGVIIYFKKYLEFAKTTGPDGPAISIQERHNTESIRLVELT